jgi:hypothetical protein
MQRSGPIKKLKRYTHLPALLHLLQTSTLTALNPSTWADQNDTIYLRRYKAKRPDVKGLFVLCMTEAADTFHHWNVYANGPSGVKIEFDPERFQVWLRNAEVATRLERVQYKRLDEIEQAASNPYTLPFLKRKAFRDENEVRLLVEDSNVDGPVYSLPHFEVSTIRTISLSPWLPAALEGAVKSSLRHAYSGSDAQWQALKVHRTSLLYNESFIRAADEA